MPTPLPDPAGGSGAADTGGPVADSLEGLLEFTGATAGWVAVRGPSGRFEFPAQSGTLPERFLSALRGDYGVWGLSLSNSAAILNELADIPSLGGPPLRNLLSCPLGTSEGPLGYIGLANKPSGFTSHDAAILQGVAHLLSRQVHRSRETPPTGLLASLLNRVGEAVLVVDGGGRLTFVNAAWLEWTGYSQGDLLGRPAPFPFWPGHRELSSIGKVTPGPSGPLPFRRRDGSVLWCQVEGIPLGDERGQVAAVLRCVSFASSVVKDANLPADLLPALALTDRHGRIVWSSPALELLLPAGPGPSGFLADRLDSHSTAALDRLLLNPGQPGRSRRLTVYRAGRPLATTWINVGLAEGPGWLFVMADASEAQGVMATSRGAVPPATDWLALLLEPGQEVDFWDGRWERLTGLSESDLAGLPGELVLDWLFPRQADRNQIADWMHDPHRRGGQAILDVLTEKGGRPLLCTAVPVSDAGGRRPGRWLLLACPSEAFPLPAPPFRYSLGSLAGGLSRLLNHYFSDPIGLAEAALDQPNQPSQTAARFQQILDSCQRASRLVAALEDLSSESVGESQSAPLADLVRAFLDSRLPPLSYRLSLDLRDTREGLVCVNPRMLRVILGHLLTNAEQAIEHVRRREVTVRVFVTDGFVCCEVEDSGEGLPGGTIAWVPKPFASTRGAFARDPAHAAQDATGLGLMVCQHLLGLHGGRLEVRPAPGGGTTAAIWFPRVEAFASYVPATRQGSSGSGAKPPSTPAQKPPR